MSQEFPKDFVPYYLQHSAQELNAELNPLVVAFNQDVAAFSQHLSTHLEEVQKGQIRLSSRNRSFLSDGIVTVRGIGGDPSVVNTTTQSVLDATQSKTLSDVLATLTGQGGSGSTGTSNGSSASALATALQSGAINSTAILPALAALAPVQAKVSIGRELQFNVTPYTLPGASSAELQVELTAGDNGTPSLYVAGKNAGAYAGSEVSLHYVKTRVRVESVKMFELSAFSALIQQPRSKVPLVPPLIELPWVGSLLSLPLSGAKEYHRSTAFVSAVIVPTAADLAYGIEFQADRQVVARPSLHQEYQLREAVALNQFPQPIPAFHRAMVSCLATDAKVFFLGGEGEDVRLQSLVDASQRRFPGAPSAGCFDLKFRDVPPER